MRYLLFCIILIPETIMVYYFRPMLTRRVVRNTRFGATVTSTFSVYKPLKLSDQLRPDNGFLVLLGHW